MRELVQGLVEVYCLTDPSLPDNLIVYASEGRLVASMSHKIDRVLKTDVNSLQSSIKPHSTGASM